ncbi:hypothetical protein KEM48_011148 [Puccinia striiformis f. sp. tritici PST-130]|nr:hypothetical protein KEM48_011148 [Puccinia striiformis f. sp. tritici PST-130]
MFTLTTQNDCVYITQELTRSLTYFPIISTNQSKIDQTKILISLHRKNFFIRTLTLDLTPEENQNLINHYLTLVKQQRADNPPPPPFVDPLTSNERLDRIIKNVLADREAELDHRIFFNQSLRDYRSDKRMQTITRRDLLFKFMVHVTNELIKDPRPTLHSKDFDTVTFKKRFKALEKALNNDRLNSPQEKKNAAVFNARFEEYKAALIQAQEVEVQATQKGDKTIIPTSKILKLETRREPLDLTIPQVTGNTLRLATSPSPLSRPNPSSKIWSQPSRESLRKRALPVISDSESEAGISIDHPSSPILEESLVNLSYLSYRIPKTNLTRFTMSTRSNNPNLEPLHPDPERRAKQARRTDQGPQTPKGTTKHPGSLGIIREPLSSDESQASSEMESESESEDEIPEAEIIRILIKKQVKIHARGRNPTRGIIHVKAAAITQIELTRITTETKHARTTAATKTARVRAETKVARTTTTHLKLTQTTERTTNVTAKRAKI